MSQKLLHLCTEEHVSTVPESRTGIPYPPMYCPDDCKQYHVLYCSAPPSYGATSYSETGRSEVPEHDRVEQESTNHLYCFNKLSLPSILVSFDETTNH